LENLEKATQITGKWKPFTQKELDGKIELKIENQIVTFNVEVKTEVREHQLMKLLQRAEENRPFMVIAQRIFPKIKETLREHRIPYLEINGNIWLQQDKLLIWIERNKPIQAVEEKINRAFTKTGLKVVFQFLLDDQWINYPYREIAQRTEVGLGNINYVMNGLQENGFLIRQNQKEFRLIKKKELLEKFMAAYQEKLKPAIHIETFRFLKEEDRFTWKKLPLKNQKTFWGGEPAGDLLTNYLNPEVFTLYTTETRNELIKNYRLIPDPKGNVHAYKKFWTFTEVNDNIVPPLLVYIDLMNTGDRRCIETANKIYEQLLQNKFE
jgi:hypothetical protein